MRVAALEADIALTQVALFDVAVAEAAGVLGTFP
jgi:hypothetical protein